MYKVSSEKMAEYKIYSKIQKNNDKRQKWGKKCLEIMTIKGGSGAGGLTPNGKNHLKFPF